MILAKLETRNFEFLALGETEEEALAALERGWEAHCREYGGTPDPDYLREYSDDIGYTEIHVGGCLRDFDALRSSR